VGIDNRHSEVVDDDEGNAIAIPAIGVRWNEGMGPRCRFGVGWFVMVTMDEVDEKGLWFGTGLPRRF
jgi:hypothetical protein